MQYLSTLKSYVSGDFKIFYIDRGNQFPKVEDILWNNEYQMRKLQLLSFSTAVGTEKIQPFDDLLFLDAQFKPFAVTYFDQIYELDQNQKKPQFAISCSDFFFEQVGVFYFSLIQNGNKNRAVLFLKKVCELVDKWEKKKGFEIHKGTPYYFLTFSYIQQGDIDSAFASTFKAMHEDERSIDPLLGKGEYRKRPAYKYISLVDDKENYLYGWIIELRTKLKEYIKIFNRRIRPTPRFSIKRLDSLLLQNPDNEIEQIKFLFSFCLQKIKAYLNQIEPMVNNDFYRIRNANQFFNLALITDKILEKKHGALFKVHVIDRSMTMNDGVALLFEDEGWIDPLNPRQKADPRNSLNYNPGMPDDFDDLIDQLFLHPVNFTCNGRDVNYQMRVMKFALTLRNFAGHSIEKQNIFVNKYPDIIQWLLSAIFVAVSTLPKPKSPAKKTPPPPAPAQPANPLGAGTPNTLTWTTGDQTIATYPPDTSNLA